PVTLQELPEIEISISALTAMRPIRIDEIVVGRHGLWIVRGLRSGLLLPEVPLHFGWDREGYLRGLCMKAGLPEDAWQLEDRELYGFETEYWSE
ncbi:MAG: AMMECR1 domain-containing protein, partial [Gemmatimonadetes bacterium]|nr:AMMECR1 domain-containing protein [Gemmatimonadota bacterium]NIS02277.1 AMMECR1 domain-containing protein [Gemmatimonadota bacterium]NIT68096.1 AMMECR1 domain-containing protein [Gemmatimonadota bacterium]NIV24723.1 AMMECR1 domain-containing protein [Gemmatimonadota bacterium]NIW76674.1 AMMECR1 domain-containing protein [Gemmatimonadota bacterium]